MFLITDQQQKATVAPDSECITPNIDKLRKDGIFFSRAYTANAICSPARASLFTGLLPHNHGMVDCTHTVPQFRAEYDESRNTLTRQLKKEGYRLGYFGKWHVERSHDLTKYGFDEYETERDVPSFKKTPIKKVEVKQKGYNDKILCGVYKEKKEATEEHYLYSKAIDFIEKESNNQDKPWCLFVSTYAPHDPYLAPKELYNLYDVNNIKLPENFDDDMQDKPNIYKRIKSVWKDLKPEDYKEAITCYYAYCTLVDTQVGRIMETLERTEQADNTIIVYMTDHGDLMGAHGLICKGVPAFEEVYNIPLIIKWPESGLKDIICDTYVNTYDIAPTILDMAKCAPMEDIDGESIVPFLGNNGNKEKRKAFAEFHGQRMYYTQRIIWRDNYKYVFNGFDYDEFYDLNKDPHELTNKINDPSYKQIIEELAREMWDIVKKSDDFNLYETDYFMFRFAPIGPEMKKGASLYNKEFN